MGAQRRDISAPGAQGRLLVRGLIIELSLEEKGKKYVPGRRPSTSNGMDI